MNAVHRYNSNSSISNNLNPCMKKIVITLVSSILLWSTHPRGVQSFTTTTCTTTCPGFRLPKQSTTTTTTSTRRSVKSVIGLGLTTNGENYSDNDNDNNAVATDAEILECATFDRTDELKNELIRLAASYDRGFGASPRARDQVDRVIEELESLNGETYAARGANGSSTGTATSPLTGSWRMIWTTAVDVLLLQASPFFTVGAIYQVFEPPVVTNIIDFLPRVQSLLPPGVIPNSLIRAKVSTRSNERTNNKNRVGLVFERVQLLPLEVLGMSIDVFPEVALNLPTLPGTSNTDDAPGYFDVTFLDADFLIIRQNAPGGLFCLIRVDSNEA